jgi:hypothetical protein
MDLNLIYGWFWIFCAWSFWDENATHYLVLYLYTQEINSNVVAGYINLSTKGLPRVVLIIFM